MRAAEQHYMDERVSIRRDVIIAPNVEEPTTIASDVPARITAGYGTFRDVADRFSGVTPYVITVAYNQDAKPGDAVIDSEGNVYNVLDVRSKGTYHIATNCLCQWVH